MGKVKKSSGKSEPQPFTATRAAFGFHASRTELDQMSKSDAFDEAIADFSIAYADQSERDHETLMQAVRSGKVEVFVERE